MYDFFLICNLFSFLYFENSAMNHLVAYLGYLLINVHFSNPFRIFLTIIYDGFLIKISIESNYSFYALISVDSVA